MAKKRCQLDVFAKILSTTRLTQSLEAYKSMKTLHWEVYGTPGWIQFGGKSRTVNEGWMAKGQVKEIT